MKCPKCNQAWLKVLETRHVNNKAIARRRQCRICDAVFATTEIIVSDDQITWKPKIRHTPDGTIVKKSAFGVRKQLLDDLDQFSAQALLASISAIRLTA